MLLLNFVSCKRLKRILKEGRSVIVYKYLLKKFYDLIQRNKRTGVVYKYKQKKLVVRGINYNEFNYLINLLNNPLKSGIEKKPSEASILEVLYSFF